MLKEKSETKYDENKVEMEVCLFDKHANASQLILVDTINKKDKTDNK